VAAVRAAGDRARLLVEECRLSAPISGIVQSRNYEPGEAVLPGNVLLTLIDLSEVTTTFYLPNAELAAARPGTRVEVVADAWPGRVFEGTITRVSAEADFTPRNVQTREDRDRLVYAVDVRIPNPEGRLRAGMPVEVTIPGTEPRR
jgi:HlyD family secretion protein